MTLLNWLCKSTHKNSNIQYFQSGFLLVPSNIYIDSLAMLTVFPPSHHKLNMCTFNLLLFKLASCANKGVSKRYFTFYIHQIIATTWSYGGFYYRIIGVSKKQT